MSEKANVYKKLMDVRLGLLSQSIKKSGAQQGRSKRYFELADFLPQAMALFSKAKLCPMVSFAQDLAVLTIRDMEETNKDAGTVIFTTPMSTANLPNCHPVQNLGAVQTYLRRYLYVAALDLVEHDAIDSGDAPAETDALAEPKYVSPPAPKKNAPIAESVVEVVTAMCFDKKDITDAVKFRYNRPKFADLSEEHQSALLADFRDCEKYFRKLMSVIEARDVPPGDEARDTELMTGALEYLKKRGDGFPLRFAASQWLKWVEELETEVFKEVDRG